MFPFSTLSHLTVHSRSWMGTRCCCATQLRYRRDGACSATGKTVIAVGSPSKGQAKAMSQTFAKPCAFDVSSDNP
jgi:hypothetical protein